MTPRIEPPDVSGIVDAAMAAADLIEGRDTASPAARRMADVIAERAGIDGCCTADDLLAAGFTQGEIAECIDDARRLFRDRVVRDTHRTAPVGRSAEAVAARSPLPLRERDRVRGDCTEPRRAIHATRDQLAAIEGLIFDAAATSMLRRVNKRDRDVLAESAAGARRAYSAILTGRAP